MKYGKILVSEISLIINHFFLYIYISKTGGSIWGSMRLKSADTVNKLDYENVEELFSRKEVAAGGTAGAPPSDKPKRQPKEVLDFLQYDEILIKMTNSVTTKN